MFGGTSVNKNRQDVARGVDILIATPGRLVDLCDQRALDLSEVEILVLDEADQMMDLGFIHALKAIVRMLPAKRQTLFFSATMPNAIKQLAGQYLTDPAQVSVAPAATTAERVAAVRLLRRPDREAGAADAGAAQGPRSRARWTACWCSPAPSTAPTAW